MLYGRWAVVWGVSKGESERESYVLSEGVSLVIFVL